MRATTTKSSKTRIVKESESVKGTFFFGTVPASDFRESAKEQVQSA